MNALKHGARSTKILLPGEDSDQFHALHQALLQQYDPQTDDERRRVDEIAALHWKRQRLDRLEWEFWTRATRPRADGTVSDTPMADALCLHHRELSLLLRYMGQTNRKLEKTEKELREMIKTRKMAAVMAARGGQRMPQTTADRTETEPPAAPVRSPLSRIPAMPASAPPGPAGGQPSPVAAPSRPAPRNSQFLPNRPPR